VAERRFSLRRWDQWFRFRALFGPMGSAERKARNPFDLVKTADPRATPYLYLGAGDKEALLEPNQRFVARLRVREFAFEFHEKSGGHDWSEWDAQIPGCFASLLARMTPLIFTN